MDAVEIDYKSELYAEITRNAHTKSEYYPPACHTRSKIMPGSRVGAIQARKGENDCR
jgi:hypothetical protein